MLAAAHGGGLPAGYVAGFAAGGIALLLIAVGLFAGGVYTLVRGTGAGRKGVRAEGVIVGYERFESRSMDTSTQTKYSVVEFTTADGERVRGRTRVASSPPAGPIGGPATVFYDPRDPSRVSVETSRTRVMSGCVGVFLMFFAVPVLGFGILLLSIAGAM